MAEVQVRAVVNGSPVTVRVPTGTLLVELVRDILGLTGTKLSCGMQVCGACTVLLDGRPVSSCSVLAADADGTELLTVEGLSRDGALSPVQQAFVAKNAIQCGYCTPGFLMAVTAMLARTPNPSRDEIVHELEGNICRCTGYLPIVEAVQSIAGSAPTESGPVVDEAPHTLGSQR